ncbi:MAG: signal peptidase I [Anaerolineae bacterium]
MMYDPGAHTPIAHLDLSLHSLASFARDWLKPLVVVTVIVLFMNLFFPRYAVHGRSMEPNLHESDRLFVTNIDLLNRPLERGELVILSSPYDGETIVKRVIGLPGETITVRGGTVYINGEALHESYIADAPRYSGEWVVGPDQLFILGDNRNNSLDSADYGPVEMSRISGVVRLRFLPLDHLSLFDLPDYNN